MKGLVFVVTSAVVGLLLLPGLVGATHSDGEGPSHDFATGTGIRTALVSGSDTRVMMHVNARSGASGQDASGQFFVKRETEPPVANRPDLDFSGRVTCMRVVGNRAIVGGVVTHDRLDLPDNPIEGTGFLGVYVDRDQEATGVADESNSTPGVARPGSVCPTTVGFPTAPFQQGNYVVHNALP